MLGSCGSHENNKQTNIQATVSKGKSHTLEAAADPAQITTAKDTFYSYSVSFPSSSSQYYEDIQFLTGKHKLTNIKFPCIEIRDSGITKIVTYHDDKDKYTAYVYHKVKNYWIAKYYSRGDTCEYWYTYEYVLPNERISFLYSNKEGTWFSDLTIEASNRETIYKPKPGLSISPELINVQTVKNVFDYKHETILSEKGNLIQIQHLRTTNKGVIEINNTDCYLNNSKNYSFDWWRAFGWRVFKKAVCQ